MRRSGRIPSIADFEKLLVTAQMERSSVAAPAAKTNMEDMSVRCGHLQEMKQSRGLQAEDA